MDCKKLFKSGLGGTLCPCGPTLRFGTTCQLLYSRTGQTRQFKKKMKGLHQELGDFCEQHSKFLNKGGLSVALVVTRHAKEMGLPLASESLLTEEGGQVVGLGKAAVQKILKTHGIEKKLAAECGRTSRGSIGLMKEYVNFLNGLHLRGGFDIQAVESWWVEKVRRHFASKGPKLNFDPGKSLAAEYWRFADPGWGNSIKLRRYKLR